MASKRPHGNEDPRKGKAGAGGLTTRYKSTRQPQGGSIADWDKASGEAIRWLVAVVCNQGGAVLLGYSRDRGAYRVIIMDDDDKITEWIPCTTDLDEALYNLAADLAPDSNGGASGAPEAG